MSLNVSQSSKRLLKLQVSQFSSDGKTPPPPNKERVCKVRMCQRMCFGWNHGKHRHYSMQKFYFRLHTLPHMRGNDSLCVLTRYTEEVGNIKIYVTSFLIAFFTTEACQLFAQEYTTRKQRRQRKQEIWNLWPRTISVIGTTRTEGVWQVFLLAATKA